MECAGHRYCLLRLRSWTWNWSNEMAHLGSHNLWLHSRLRSRNTYILLRFSDYSIESLSAPYTYCRLCHVCGLHSVHIPIRLCCDNILRDVWRVCLYQRTIHDDQRKLPQRVNAAPYRSFWSHTVLALVHVVVLEHDGNSLPCLPLLSACWSSSKYRSLQLRK